MFPAAGVILAQGDREGKIVKFVHGALTRTCRPPGRESRARPNNVSSPPVVLRGQWQWWIMAKHHPDLVMCRKQPGIGEWVFRVGQISLGLLGGAGGGCWVREPASREAFGSNHTGLGPASTLRAGCGLAIEVICFIFLVGSLSCSITRTHTSGSTGSPLPVDSRATPV